MSIVAAHDAIHANIGHLPPGQAAGYTTGSADIQWTANDWITHPGAVRICQDAAASDATADVLDVERGAATNAEAGPWARRALASFNSAARPGQRMPAVYTSMSNVTPLVNAGLPHGVYLWIADWNIGETAAIADITSAGGPWPVIGMQYASGQFYDSDVFSSGWLSRVSTGAAHKRTTDGVTTWAQYAQSRGSTLQGFLERSVLPYADAAAALGDEIPKAGTPYYTAF